jgi:hypothetical protein
MCRIRALLTRYPQLNIVQQLLLQLLSGWLL